VDCVCTFDVANVLCQMAEFVGKAGVPDVFIFYHIGEMVILYWPVGH
jgi:hypothetical protein